MSDLLKYIFGGSGDSAGATPPPPPVTPATTTIDALSSGVDKVDDMLKPDVFDPSVLERMVNAAKALKDAGDTAKDVVDLARTQEQSWQKKYSAIEAEKLANVKALEVEQVRTAERERRSTLQAQTQEEQKRAQYNDQLARKRYEDQLRQQQQFQAKVQQQQEESDRRKEMERRRTIDYEASLREKQEIAKARAQAEIAIRQERENKDIREEQLKLQAVEFRHTVMQGIEKAATTVGEGISGFLQDPLKVGMTVGTITAMALGVYASKNAASVAGKYFSSRVGKPPLIRDTSRRGLTSPTKALGNLFSRKTGDVLEGIVLKPDLQARLQAITVATAHTRQHKGNFRHVMLTGPPGTGKTLFARRLAKQSGLDYAILAGGDVGALGRDGVTEIHKVFDWAETTSRGMLLFVDEADAFLRKRAKEEGGVDMSEDLRNALSTFLYRTGTPTNKFCLVFATNTPYAFDRAVTDRVDEVVTFDNPGLGERVNLLQMYWKDLVVEGGGSTAHPILVGEDVADLDWADVAKRLEGFSGRSIMKLCSAFQASAYASKDNSIDKTRVYEILQDHLEQMALKERWAGGDVAQRA